MPKRALDEDDCVDGDGEADGILPVSVIISSGSTEQLEDVLRVGTKEDEDDDGDRQSECSAVMESSGSDDTSLQTDGSTDAADPCSACM